jgi:hypothetical protein
MRRSYPPDARGDGVNGASLAASTDGSVAGNRPPRDSAAARRASDGRRCFWSCGSAAPEQRSRESTEPVEPNSPARQIISQMCASGSKGKPMKAQRKSKQFVILTICLGAATLWTDPTHSQTFKAYAEACLNELQDRGSKPIVFPELLQCEEGEILPIQKDFEDIPARTQNDAKFFTDKTECDKPPLLGISKGGIGQCVPNSRLQVRRVSQVGVEKENWPYYALLCRNYKYRSLLSQAKNPEYDDVAMIVYSPVNHKTCFFQKMAQLELRGLPQAQSDFPAVESLPGEDIPSPFGTAAERFWSQEQMKNINCASCHDANPFMHSPYAFQVTADKTNGLPNRTFGEAYNIVALDQLGDAWKKYHAYFDIDKDKRKRGEVGACVVCHSLGPGLSSGKLTEYSAGTPAPSQLVLDTSPLTLTHWMPSPLPSIVKTKEEWDALYRASVKEIVACHDDNKKDGCNLKELK